MHKDSWRATCLLRHYPGIQCDDCGRNRVFLLDKGTARVPLRLQHEGLGTLYSVLLNRELEGEIAQNLQEPKTSVAGYVSVC